MARSDRFGHLQLLRFRYLRTISLHKGDLVAERVRNVRRLRKPSFERWGIHCELKTELGKREWASSCEYPSRFLERAAGNTEVKRGEAILISALNYPKDGKERSTVAADLGRLGTPRFGAVEWAHLRR